MGLRGLRVADPVSGERSKEKALNHGSLRNSIYLYKVPGRIVLPTIEIPESLKKVLKNNLQETLEMSKMEKNLARFLSKLTKAKMSPSKDHLRNLKILVLMEQYHLDVELNKHALMNQKIKKSPNSFNPFFSISVPDLDVDDPFVTIGDEVILDGKYYLKIIDIENGRILAVSEGLSSKWFEEKRHYNVTFKLFNYTVRCTLFALKRLSDSTLTSSFLHPVEQEKTPKACSERRWNNIKAKKNPEQKQAIDNIIQKTATPAPYILFGPPGTGKTSTLVEAIYQIYSCRSDNILVCTPSNAAADELTKRLLQCVPHSDILRLYSHTRETDLIDHSILPCANVDKETGRNENENDKMKMRKAEILEKKIIISTLMNSLRLLGLNLETSYFSYVFIDEAGQATEPEALIPLTLLVDSQKTRRNSTQIVLAGDHMQLGPVVKSKLIENLLGVSLMERLMSLPVYKKDENNKYNPLYVTKLINNFRSHSAILKVPNKLFYDNELKACASKVHKAENWQQLPNKRLPVIFHAVSGSERKKKGNNSTYNLEEIDVVAEYIKMILASNKFKKKNIAVITPFKLQEKYIQKSLHQKKLSEIDVGTVQIFQGQEREVIILSTVRSRLLQLKDEVHIGFLGNQKRFNVSITRAKSLLIVIGNPHVLKFGDHWREFLSYCLENKACLGEKFSLSNFDADRRRFMKHPVYVSDSSDDEDDALANFECRPQIGQSMTVSLSEILESKVQYVRG